MDISDWPGNTVTPIIINCFLWNLLTACKTGEDWAAVLDTAVVRAGSAVLEAGAGEELPWPLHLLQSPCSPHRPCRTPGADAGQLPVSREGGKVDAFKDLLAPSLIEHPPNPPFTSYCLRALSFSFFYCVWSQVFSPLACRFTGDQSTHKEVSRQAGVMSAGPPGWTTVRWGASKLREKRNLSELRFSFLLF